MLNTSSPIPLDFIANGTFLSTSISEHLAAEGLSHETTITLEYARSLVPPVYEASFEHDDWVSAVDVLSPSAPVAAGADANERVASASYDGLVRVWDRSGNLMAVSPPSVASQYRKRLDTMKWLSPKQLVSAGLEERITVWDYAETDDGSAGSLKPRLELWGHDKRVHSLAVDASTGRMLSSSEDGCLGLWSWSKQKAPPADPECFPFTHFSKKGQIAAPKSAQRGPLVMIKLNDDSPISAVTFHHKDPTVAYWTSGDGTVRTVDLATAKEVSRLATQHQFNCLAALPNSLVAAAGRLDNIVLLDPRESTATTTAMTLKGHVNWVSSLCPSPENDYSLVSGSWDSTCRVWDLRRVDSDPSTGSGRRAIKPAYTIKRQWLEGKKLPEAGDGAKVLSVVWDKSWGIVSGGEDKKVQVNRGRNLLS